MTTLFGRLCCFPTWWQPLLNNLLFFSKRGAGCSGSGLFVPLLWFEGPDCLVLPIVFVDPSMLFEVWCPLTVNLCRAFHE